MRGVRLLREDVGCNVTDVEKPSLPDCHLPTYTLLPCLHTYLQYRYIRLELELDTQGVALRQAVSPASLAAYLGL